MIIEEPGSASASDGRSRRCGQLSRVRARARHGGRCGSDAKLHRARIAAAGGWPAGGSPEVRDRLSLQRPGPIRPGPVRHVPRSQRSHRFDIEPAHAGRAITTALIDTLIRGQAIFDRLTICANIIRKIDHLRLSSFRNNRPRDWFRSESGFSVAIGSACRLLAELR
jgi:hypothetical protein